MREYINATVSNQNFGARFQIILMSDSGEEVGETNRAQVTVNGSVNGQ
jgi:hypothetical protein